VFKRIIYIVITFILISAQSEAGNHEIIHPTEGHSIGWSQGIIPYWIDQGPLGILSNPQAKYLVESMMKVWEDEPTAEVDFTFQDFLPEDVTVENFPDYLSMTSCGGSDRPDIPENVVPIIFDNTGKILEYLTGLGSSGEIGGLATLRCFNGSLEDPESIHQGMVIINGGFIDNDIDENGEENEDSPRDLSTNAIAGIILHEVGHLIGLDHSVVNSEVYDQVASGIRSINDSKYIPAMLPTVLRTSNSTTTLHPDDISALSTLYPTREYLESVGTIEGEILDANEEDVRKVNVIARKTDDPLCEAVSTVSGRRCTPLLGQDEKPNFNVTYCSTADELGDYLIEGLIPGEYTVEVEDLESGWIRAGMYPSSYNEDMPGNAEFYNESDDTSDDMFDHSIVRVVANETIEDISIVLDNTVANEDQINRIPISRFTPGPGTRCTNDPVDLSEAISNVSDEVNLDANSSAEIDDEVSGSKGGCSLIRGKTKSISILPMAILLLIALLINSRKKFMKKNLVSILVLSVIILSSNVSNATSIVPSTLEGMSKKAGTIFYGKCIDTETIIDEQNIVSTLVTYEIFRGVKGTKAETITFKIFGKTSPDTSDTEAETTVGVSNFYPGREDVLFLYKESPWGFTAPIGLWQGNIPVIKTEEGPRLNVKSKSYKKTMNTKSISSTSEKDSISTPDELLDRVEEILN